MFFLSLPSRGLKGPPDDCHDPEASQGSIFSGLTNHQRGWLGCLNFCRIKLLQRHTGWPAIVAYACRSAKSSGIAELRYAGAGPPLDLPCAKPWHPLSAPSSATLKASRPLIRVLVINDNGLWINDFIRDNENMLIHGRKGFDCERVKFRDDMQSSGSRQRYKIGVLYFTGHKVFRG